MLQMNDNNRQIHIHNVPTDAFFNETEKDIHQRKQEIDRTIRCSELNSDKKDYIPLTEDQQKELKDQSSQLKSQLKNTILLNNITRTLNQDYLQDKSVISLFDSILTRTIGINENQLTEDLIIVETFYEGVLKQLINDGFDYNGEHYIFYSASAGQTRNKRSMFIKEDVWKAHEGALMAGLTEEEINEKGGININKFLAYKALMSSSTNEWVDFDINRTIVVDDLESDVHDTFDEIKIEDGAPDNFKVTRKDKTVTMEHTDGAGMVLPDVSDKAFMVRLPFIKGLLVPFDFQQFATEKAGTYMVTDIYGDEHDVRDVDVVFTKSQFKMHKFYEDWSDYQSRFINNSCQAGILNVEDTRNDAKFNYQFLQTLTDITDDELKAIADETIEDIKGIGTKEKMMKLLKANPDGTPFQKALNMMPELLNDQHAKELIKETKDSKVKDARSGKVDINGKFTFAMPDMYAFCQHLFGLEVTGLLGKYQVFTRLYDEDKVDVLRSPHLYREHAVRNNVKDEEMEKWFITEGLYSSIHDPMALLLALDWDGDKVLVTPDETIVDVAERNMKDIVPLDYEMAEAQPSQVTSQNIYESLSNAYQANIGEISNDISKIWNDDEEVDMESIKWLSALNNYEIDFAKTLYKPEKPDSVDERIKRHSNKKLPDFFKYAKDKDSDKVEPDNNSPVNRMKHLIPNPDIRWKYQAGKLDYGMMMTVKKVKNEDADLQSKYDELNKGKFNILTDHGTEGFKPKTNREYVIEMIRDELLQFGSAECVVNQLVHYLYKGNTRIKRTLWDAFGEEILANIEANMEIAKTCPICESTYKPIHPQQKACPDNRCKDRKKKQDRNERQKTYRKKHSA